MKHFPSGFERRDIELSGVRITLLVAGAGPDLVFLHGAGTFPGFAALLPWAAERRVIIPFHPNFGASADSAALTGIDDYVLHYMDLFDALGLASFDLAGFSLGGWIAAEFAIRQPLRVRKLVLVAPAGLEVPTAPPPDLFALPPQEVPAYLTHDPMVAVSYFPKGPDPQFEAGLGREMGALARIIAPHPQGSPRLGRWLHRLTMPTLLVWGAEDRLMPAAQAEAWRRAIPGCRLESIPAAGHLVFEEAPATAKLITAFLAS